jgi:lactoylglutathione lyase
VVARPYRFGRAEPYTGGRDFGHLAYAVDNIYDTCSAFIARGVTINRPPRDGRMAFIRTPDGISIELLRAAKRWHLQNPGPAWPTPVPGRAWRPGMDWIVALLG